jgi:processive 1,2-diacylglycerol beta-glucosyltransferase
MQTPGYRRRGGGPTRGDRNAKSVLIVSASMGAGHDGAARELGRRLERAGQRAEIRDLLDAAPLRLGRLLRWVYELELRHAPRAYDRTYQLWYRAPWLCPLVSWLTCLLTRRRLMRWVRRSGASAVVSTYPLATLSIGRLREIGRLRVPAINFITDFGVHPLWVHKGMDLNLAVHPLAAEEARRRTGRPAVACGPLVADCFASAKRERDRAATRAALGLGPSDVAVLVVAGSWGVGDVEETVAAVAEGPGLVPVVACGRDELLRRRLLRHAATAGRRSVVLGWTEQMPEVMAACDALVENAGGLTSLEALRAGLPVVSFRPIAGHGRANTAMMAATGVSRAATDRDELLACLAEVTRPGPGRRALIEAGRAIFAADGTTMVLDTLDPTSCTYLSRPRRLRVAWASTCRAATGLTAAAALTWGGLTTGVGMATAFGAGVAHAVPGSGPVAFVGVRVDAAELVDPALDRAVRSLGATLVVDRATAYRVPSQVRRLAAEGVDIENGGQGLWLGPSGRPVAPTPWDRALGDVSAGRALAALVGRPVRIFVPGRGVNAFDLLDSGAAHDSIVVADLTVDAATTPPSGVPTPGPRQIVVIDGADATPAQVVADLAGLRAALARAGLTCVPLAGLYT